MTLSHSPEGTAPGRSDESPRGGSGAMFDGIAVRYDLLNRINSFGTDRSWRRRAVRALELRPGGFYVDLATGTADVALEILRQESEARVLGLDPSQGMLAVGRGKVETAGLQGSIELREGAAEKIDVPDSSADGVAISFGIRNVEDRPQALAEMARVTRPDGRIAILELTEPRSGLLAPLARFHVHTLVPRVGTWLSGAQEYRYLGESIAAFPSPSEFAALMVRSGLEMIAVEPLMFGACHLFVARPAQEVTS
jgi:demethylmenaquinone methyltransferase/2-methoxy-6-polyprenyl-1,4-benzoquinol methylase